MHFCESAKFTPPPRRQPLRRLPTASQIGMAGQSSSRVGNGMRTAGICRSRSFMIARNAPSLLAKCCARLSGKSPSLSAIGKSLSLAVQPGQPSIYRGKGHSA